MQKVIKYFKEEIDTGIRKPTDYPYMKFLRLNLIFLSSWPDKEIGESSSKCRVLIKYGHMLMQLIYFVSFCVGMKNIVKTQDFIERGHSYLSLLITILCVSRAVIISVSPTWDDVIEMYIKTMHLFYYKDASAYAMKIHKRIHFLANIYTVWLAAQVCMELTLFTFIPVYNNYSSGKYKHMNLYNDTYEHSVPIYLPFDTDTNIYGYIFLFSLNLVYTYLYAVLMFLLDLLQFIIIFNLWGHYLILLHDLRSFPLPANTDHMVGKNMARAQMYSEQELFQVSKRLKDCIDYHRLITDFSGKVSDAFGPILFIYYIWHQVVECVLLFQCSQLKSAALILYGVFTLIMVQQLIQLSVIFELIGTTSEKLKDGVYGVPWEFMDTKNRKSVFIFLLNVDEPVHVNALGIIKVGVTSMVAILKNSFSYYCFLRTVYDSKH